MTEDQKQKLDLEGVQKVIGDYLFTEKKPLRDDVIAIMQQRPSLRERGTVTERIIDKTKAFVRRLLTEWTRIFSLIS